MTRRNGDRRDIPCFQLDTVAGVSAAPDRLGRRRKPYAGTPCLPGKAAWGSWKPETPFPLHINNCVPQPAALPVAVVFCGHQPRKAGPVLISRRARGRWRRDQVKIGRPASGNTGEVCRKQETMNSAPSKAEERTVESSVGKELHDSEDEFRSIGAITLEKSSRKTIATSASVEPLTPTTRCTPAKT